VRRGRARAGFTLIEMMAAVALFALLAAMVGPRVAAITARDLRREAEELGRTMELGRQRSVVTGIPHQIRLDLDEVSYTLEWAPGQGEPAAAAPAGANGLEQRGPLDLSAPYEAELAFEPLPGMLGDTVLISDDVVISGVETSEGYLERGQVAIRFETDGTATSAAVFLGNEADRSLVLDVLPLADRVRIRDEE
jgi:prepilin-type N-terminal cleavage/methylation domain-containing protein